MKLNINSARKGNSQYSFSPLSLVSLDFARLQPVMIHSVLIGDKFSQYVGNGLLRCTPQVFPPFGRMNLKTAAFFIPDSQIFSWSSAFHSDNKVWRGQDASSTPVFEHSEFNYFFLINLASPYFGPLSTLVVNNPATPPARNTYDFSYPVSNPTAGTTNLAYYKLTTDGWKLYAVFKALGYDFIPFDADFTGAISQTQHLQYSSSKISAVPFLAYAKVWNDFYCNSYQADKNPVSEVLQKIYLNKDVVIGGNTVYDSSNFTMTFKLILYMLSYMTLPYESNMYTNAWNNPNDPTGVENTNINQVNSQSLISPYGTYNRGEFQSLSANSGANLHGTTPTTGNRVEFSELGHKTLEAFDKFVRRRNLVGSKAVQQLYALFGVEPDEWKKDYVVKLCENSSRVNFNAVTSQSDTVNGSNGKPLGAYAGAGLGGYNISFSYDSNTYGTILCLVWLNIDPILMHGVHPDVLRVKPLDFYNPDFDGKAYRPIPYLEVTGAKSLEAQGIAKNTFGYTNMYDDYRNMRDVVAGAFVDDTTRHFAFMRDLTETRSVALANNTDMYPQSALVQYWGQNNVLPDITNPFITDGSLGDRFWFCIDWDIKCTRPILSQENSFDIDGEGSISITKNGDGMA